MPKALAQIGSESLQAAYLRDEIPAAMLWLRREGVDTVDAELLDRYLYLDGKVGAQRLDALVDADLLRRTPSGAYELTEPGAVHGARVHEHQFAELENVSVAFFCECGCCGALPESGESPGDQRERARVAG
jgi:hypothetical protein